MKRRTTALLGLLALAVASLGGCEIVRGENRVWRPGDPDYVNDQRFAPVYVVPSGRHR